MIASDTDTLVRERAYLIWEAEGRPEGRAAEHWFQALEAVYSAPMTTPSPMTTPPAKAAPKRVVAPPKKRSAK